MEARHGGNPAPTSTKPMPEIMNDEVNLSERHKMDCIPEEITMSNRIHMS